MFTRFLWFFHVSVLKNSSYDQHLSVGRVTASMCRTVIHIEGTAAGYGKLFLLLLLHL